MKTNCDIPAWDCNTCRYSSPETHTISEMDVVECRRNMPTSTGFPVMPVHSWCWDGKLSDKCVEALQRAEAGRLMK